MLTPQVLRHVSISSIAFAAIFASACGGKSSSPTSPSPSPATPSPRVTIEVSPNPLVATLRSSTGSAGTFRISPSLTFRESGGVSVTITNVTGTIVRRPSQQASSGSLNTSLALPASGSVVDTYTQDFDVTADVDSVIWRVVATGTDSQGRAFTATSVDVTVNPTTSTAPPAASGSARLELWGGANANIYLGCWSCNQFDSESVFNQFGRYGSRFSQTSVWNHFSEYGSQFSSTSACNSLATNPPRILNTGTRTYTELTVNTIRPFRDTSVFNYLKTTICEL